MLNELHDLARSLHDLTVSIPSWHTNFKTCPKGPVTYFGLIDSSGHFQDLEKIADKVRLLSIRKWEVAAGISFPAFNVLPLFEPGSEEMKKAAVDLRKALSSKSPPSSPEITVKVQALLSSSSSLWTDKEFGRVTKCIVNLPQAIKDFLGPSPDDFRSITELIARSTKVNVELLKGQITSLLLQKISGSTAADLDWFDALFYHSGKTPKKWALVLELSDRSSFDYPANHERVVSWMNSRFQPRAISNQSETSTEKTFGDAFDGPALNLDASFPSVRLPILGNVILRSMSSESPCQRRYGVADSESFPVGQATRQELKNGLEWIGEPKRRGRTWCDVSSLTGARGILFAYPSEKPEMAPELAGLMVGQENDDPDGVKFEACVTRVITSLTALKDEAPSVEIRVFVLTKPDKFRTKVLHSARYSAERLLASAKQWKEFCRNIPPVKIRQFGPNKGDKTYWADPLVPFPGEVVNSINTAWERAGTHAAQVAGFGIGEGLGLLLEEEAVLSSIARRALRGMVTNSLSLAMAIGLAHRRGNVHPMGKKLGKQALLLPSILGLLLAKLGRMKGEYMKQAPFLIGRLMSLADQLHAQYCQGVRKGQTPPQLLGNALMPTALEQPRRAVDLLARRILPYQAWARTVQGGDEVRLAKYFLGELGRLCSELKELQLPTSNEDGGKAEMLLGYLASPEKSKDDNPSPQPTIEGDSA